MKVLSIRQPWAHLIVSGVKTTENRTWRTNHRGSLLIHAGGEVETKAYEILRSQDLEHHLPDNIHELPRGGIVGLVEVFDCVEDSTDPWHMEAHWGWRLRKASRLPFFAMPGKLGLFTLTTEQQGRFSSMLRRQAKSKNAKRPTIIQQNLERMFR